MTGLSGNRAFCATARIGYRSVFMSNATSQPDPGMILQTLTAFEQTQALKGAIDLDLFTAIADGATTPAALAKSLSASERGVRILCDYLTVHGFLTKADGVYGLSPTAAVFLNKHLPMYMGGMANFLAHPTIAGTFNNVADAVRRGGAADGSSTVDPDNPIWVEFARSMAGFLGAVGGMVAGIVARPREAQKVLDIAAGHGMFGLSVAKLNPQAEIYALDWKNVLAVASENAERMGLSARFHTIPGSAFDTPLGEGYNLVLIPNFLHHFDHATNVAFLKRVRAALAPGGVVATSEFVPNPDRVSPPMPAAFSLQMLCGTQTGDAFTFAELDAMFKEAGFSESTAQAMPPTPQTLILTKV
jgi:2-polyprenyl-3-methyl-5-hydroxy-6-metoxy-1,4-benzoquinol methylase